MGQPLTITLQGTIKAYIRVSAFYGLLGLGWTDLPPSRRGFDLAALWLPSS